MFRHILVPLDGSHLAEAALSAARTLAARLGARITLLHVLEENPPDQVHGDRHLTSLTQAEAYLSDLVERLRHAGLTVEAHAHEVPEGDVARSISRHAQELEADLIILCTHGSGGLVGFVVGSIAQQVIGAGEAPVLILHPDAAPAEFQIRSMVVPLDGASCHESSVPLATDLARMIGAHLQLATIVPQRGHLEGAGSVLGRMLPSAMSALLDEQERELSHRLDDLVAELQAKGVQATRRLERGDPIPGLLKILKEAGADLVVLSTHTRRGWAAFWSGSVAPRLINQWRRPVLLVRAEPEKQA